MKNIYSKTEFKELCLKLFKKSVDNVTSNEISQLVNVLTSNIKFIKLSVPLNMNEIMLFILEHPNTSTIDKNNLILAFNLQTIYIDKLIQSPCDFKIRTISKNI